MIEYYNIYNSEGSIVNITEFEEVAKYMAKKIEGYYEKVEEELQ